MNENPNHNQQKTKGGKKDLIAINGKTENSHLDSASMIEVEDNIDFAKYLDECTDIKTALEEGDVVRGKVIAITQTDILIDINYKSEGVIAKDEFTDNRGNLKVNIGDEVEVLVELKEDTNGRIKLSHSRAASMKIWEKIEEAYRNNEIIKGKVVERVKGGLAVDIGIRAFLPGSLIDTHPVKNLDSFIGEEIEVKVIKSNKKRGNIVLSRKIILDEENQIKKLETLKTLQEGDVLKGTVKNITSYGAFIDLGGIDGLLHITDMSWGRIAHPSELFVVGDEIEVKVLAFDREQEKVSLGYKQKTSDPWGEVVEKYPVGQKADGKVTSITDYGAFVELEEGIEGLIHISEMSWDKKIKHPSKIVGIGDNIQAVVLEIDKESRKISLGLKQTEPNPWEKIAKKYEVGQIIEGKVRNITNFGAFVAIEEGIDGLIHVSDISYTKRINHPSEVLKKGDVVKARILNIDPENQQISLGLKQLASAAWDEFFESHKVGDIINGKVTRITTFGAFVEVASDVEGLIHISEINIKKVEKPEDILTEGSEYTMKIINLDREEKKIGLSIKAILLDEKKKKKRKPKPKKTEQPKAKAEKKEGTINIGDLIGAKLSSLREKSIESQKTSEETVETLENKDEAESSAEIETPSEATEDKNN
jgi:small subunit ribosomal protein S1